MPKLMAEANKDDDGDGDDEGECDGALAGSCVMFAAVAVDSVNPPSFVAETECDATGDGVRVRDGRRQSSCMCRDDDDDDDGEADDDGDEADGSGNDGEDDVADDGMVAESRACIIFGSVKPLLLSAVATASV